MKGETMTTRSDLLTLIKQVLEKDHDIPPGRVEPHTVIANLGIDSLGMIELIFSMEDRLGINIGAQDKQPATIGDVIDLIAEHLSNTAAAQG
jgi:acyl carrier protein